MKRGRKPAAPGSGGRMPRTKLAEAIAPIAEDYVAFVQTHPEGEQPGDSKAFAARHSAGLTALQHLTELAALVSGETSAEGGQDQADKALEEARTRMAKDGDGGGTPG